jgi:hypothetical protein
MLAPGRQSPESRSESKVAFTRVMSKWSANMTQNDSKNTGNVKVGPMEQYENKHTEGSSKKVDVALFKIKNDVILRIF